MLISSILNSIQSHSCGLMSADSDLSSVSKVGKHKDGPGRPAHAGNQSQGAGKLARSISDTRKRAGVEIFFRVKSPKTA